MSSNILWETKSLYIEGFLYKIIFTDLFEPLNEAFALFDGFYY